MDDEADVVLRILDTKEVRVLLEDIWLGRLPASELVVEIDEVVEKEAEGSVALLTLGSWDSVDVLLVLVTLDAAAPLTSSAESVSEAYVVLTTP